MPRWLNLAAVLALVAASSAAAEEDARFAVERFAPALSRESMNNIEDARVGRNLDYDVGLHLGYELNPLILYQNGKRVDALVAHRLHGNVTGAISLFEWVQLGLDVPLVLFQTRNASAFDATLGTTRNISAIGVGDARLVPKIRILRAEDQFLDLAIIPALGIPTGFPGDSYLGDGFLTFSPELVAGIPLGAFRLALDVGYLLRQSRSVLDVTVGPEIFYRGGLEYSFAEITDLPLALDLTASGATSGTRPFVAGLTSSPLEAAVGAKYDVWGPFQLAGYLGAGLVGGFGAPDFRAGLILRASGRERDLDADDDGVLDDADQCRDDPEDKDGYQDADGCPDPDNDGDRILDASDQCPLEAEDADGFDDANGCPDLDHDGDQVLDVEDVCPNVPGLVEKKGCPRLNTDQDSLFDDEDECVQEPGPRELMGCPDRDGDGIVDGKDECPDQPGSREAKGCPDRDGDRVPDPKDKCPDQPETINGMDDDDGCPEKDAKVTLTRDKIEILDKVYFDTGKSTIQQRSFALLDQAAAVLAAHPEIKKVRVEGHTDSKGNDDFNLKLSEARAKAVVTYLTEHGIRPEVLAGVGYGETRPISDNKTAAGREQNRRVEFMIVEQGQQQNKETP